VLINLRIDYFASEATHGTETEQALNYRTIAKAIIRHVEENRVALLERLTEEILYLLMVEAPVQYAEVEVDKLHALRFAESVSITLGNAR